ncbi:MAG: hypothetical protein AAGI69_02290 [Cyanobacteria bacterium P01_H01_bin.21]
MHYDSGNFPPKSRVFWPKVLSVGIGLWLHFGAQGLAQTAGDTQPINATPPPAAGERMLLPPADDVPEEILRTEIIFEARSPLDGRPLSPAEYAQLQTELAASQTTLTLNSDIRYIIFLLQARRAFKPVIPFLP